MKGLVCKVCGYVALDGNKELCPVCKAKDSFEEKEDAYKMPDFVAESGESEKKHIPAITVVEECGLIPGTGCIDVHVKVGEITHPMLPAHYITSVVFYHENKYIGKATLTSDINPAAVVHLKEGTKGKIQVIENCNLHGNWYNEVEIK